MTHASVDSELTALGERLVEILGRIAPARAEHRRLSDEAHDFAYHQTGWKPSHEPRKQYEKEFEEYLLEYNKMAARNGFNANDKLLNDLNWELDPIMREIMRTPATPLPAFA